MSKYWTRKGLFYYAYIDVYKTWGPTKIHVGTVERCYDFVTYHLIKWIHGEEEMQKLATAPPRVGS